MTKRYIRKQPIRNRFYSQIKTETIDYEYEQEMIKIDSCCLYECCGGYKPMKIIDIVSDDLLCYVIQKQ